MVYLPMCYLYGKKFVYSGAAPVEGGSGGETVDPLVAQLREELYDPQAVGAASYDDIPWNRTRHWVADIDNYSPVHPLMAFLQDLLRNVWERSGGFGLLRRLRGAGLAFAKDYMAAEDLQTNFVDIGPVNKALNMLVCWVAGDEEQFQRHVLRVPDYLWVAEDGMKMQGYNGSQCWDTSFAVQASMSAVVVLWLSTSPLSVPYVVEARCIFTSSRFSHWHNKA